MECHDRRCQLHTFHLQMKRRIVLFFFVSWSFPGGHFLCLQYYVVRSGSLSCPRFYLISVFVYYNIFPCLCLSYSCFVLSSLFIGSSIFSLELFFPTLCHFNIIYFELLVVQSVISRICMFLSVIAQTLKIMTVSAISLHMFDHP